MDQLVVSTCSLYSTIILLALSQGISGATFTLINRCSYTVWPGILANAGSPSLESTGFELPSGESRSFLVQPSWSGRLWGRTGCTSDPTTGHFTCLTADCNSNQMECTGNNAQPPATLAEFTIGSGEMQDFYDVSLVDGYNLPVSVEPNGGSGSCQMTGCAADLNRACPAELRPESGDACKSACEAFGSPEYCCSGAYATPDTCKPSVYSEMFKTACPRSYSYAYDDPTSTFTCRGADYVITFCPLLGSSKTLNPGATTTPTIATPTTTNGSSGTSTSSDDTPTGSASSWLPNFLTGGSSNTLTSPTWLPLMIASTISCFSLLNF